MPRPSRNIDELLLRTGREVLAESGSRALSIRHLTQRAGVNLGMFHYHFKSRENFIRTLLQQMYDEMFASLSLQVEREASSHDSLRGAVFAWRHVQLEGDKFVATWGDAVRARAGQRCPR